MRRTYRSKKDTGGALDHRDVLLNMDEKSSAFDAFYIQNIKQTKRELSCVASSNHIGVASNKVRKRKYVKRIIKEVEPVRQRETLSSSAYLTPDKSIRVNKVLDPFDMLLNTSVACQDSPKANRAKKSEKLLLKKESKTYTRKKEANIKKINDSTSDSNSTESDKENTSNLKSNVTDIRKHELLVVKECRSSPKHLDESINQIVNNLSLLNNFKRKISNSSFNTSYKCRNRAKNIQSPISLKSPLCSTPFKEKYRGVSIFKFSPISQKNQALSPNYNVILEENNKSNGSIILTVDNSKVSKKYASPFTHSPDISIKNESINMSVIVNEDNSSASKQQDMDHSGVENTKNEMQTSTSDKQSSFQMIEAEPFLGFSNNTVGDINEDKSYLLKCIEEITTISIQEDNLDLNEEDYQNDNNDTLNISNTSHQCNTNRSSAGSRNSSKHSFYDSCNSELSFAIDSHQCSREPVIAIERMNDSLFMKYYKKIHAESQNEVDMNQTEKEDFESFTNDSNEEVFNNSLSIESDCTETEPNAIVITDSSTTEDFMSNNEESDDEACNDTQPDIKRQDDGFTSFVTTRRRNEVTNDSMFVFDNSYGNSSTDCDKTVLSNVNIHSEKPEVNISVESSSSKHDLVNIDTNEGKCVKKDLEYVVSSPDAIISRVSYRKTLKLPKETVLASDNDLNLTESCLPMQTISRILTRKSSKYPSPNCLSSELDNRKNKTILESGNETVHENETDMKNGSLEFYLENEIPNLSLTTKNPSAIFQGNIVMNNSERSYYADVEKPSIVLQPGKKWERSLSIYRRMTMAADHFDQSILDEECLQKKGRKYRQSVISTMEMQELRGSLHNDSINSRRSTFVSKPSRPTIKFVKDPNTTISRVSLNATSVFDDLKGFLNEECDDTVIELSKLSIADSEHEITILDNFHESERVATARDYVLRRCKQTEPILFDECYPETVLKNCHKIGEGVYGEVFLWRGRDGRARVMKIVPIAGTIRVNGEDQKDFHEIISEIVIAMELSALRAPIADIERQLDEGNDIDALELHAIKNATDTFNEVLAVRCVYGAYPSRLLDLWELYDECKGSENDSPAALPADQRYIVLELANAGQDLESYQFAGAQQAHALFQQIAFGLAVAEEAFQFEHRDLHWGNVLIAPTEQKFATFVLRGRAYRVPRCGVAATIIDYSLSRLTLPLDTDSAALYNDLATDEQLFDAVGDYQFEVYRLMREKLGNDWKNFEPYTNILWLHYTVDKMITALRYKRTNTKIHKHYIEKLKGIKGRILEYGSAVQYVLTDIDF